MLPADFVLGAFVLLGIVQRSKLPKLSVNGTRPYSVVRFINTHVVEIENLLCAWLVQAHIRHVNLYSIGKLHKTEELLELLE